VYVKQFQSDARAREKPCLRCGTSLRKNLDDKYCPECGLSVWLSLNLNDTLEW
jgi:ribosomal protein S27AE